MILHTMMKPFSLVVGLSCALSLSAIGAESAKPIRALLITGGCCHDYGNQKVILPQGIGSRANIEWTVVQEGGNGTRHERIQESVYNKPDWSKGYDIVVHNECFADDADMDYIEKVLGPHREGLPGVVIHCTMHTFRALKTNSFREFLGVKSMGHGPQHPCDVKNVKSDHPIMKAFPPVWTTGNEELYAIDNLFPNTTPLATAGDKKKDASGQWVPGKREHAIIWVNTYGKGKVFGTSLAHNNKTMQDPIFLDLVTRGMLWACDKLDENGLPKAGYDVPAKK